MNLTPMEKDVIIAIAENNYSSNPTDEVWSFSICENTTIVNENQVSGVVSSLVKKGLVVSRDYDNDRTVCLTDKGLMIYYELKGE